MGNLTAAECAELEQLLAEQERRQRKALGFGFVPHNLHPKQLRFLALTCREALFGGAAGGGKTDALLAAALQHVEVPGYSALLLRRTFTALSLPNAIMDRARQWLAGTAAVWRAEQKQWVFPSGAVVQFGYCDSQADLDRYQSAEFQFVGIDEVTEWPEQWYRFLFSRLRRPVSLNVPLRFRAATNPGGLGQEWVRSVFSIPENRIIDSPIGLGTETVFLPSRADDNPSLDLAAYEESLRHLGPQKYEQLRWGRWIRDGQGLVYGEFNEARNVIDRLPESREWERYLSLDFGVVDRNAIAILAWRPHDPITYVERCYKFRGGPSALAEEVQPLYRGLRCSKIIGDTGGMGKAYQEELARRWQLPVRAARKHDKLGNIALLNSALHDGLVRVVGAQCGDLIDEWKTLPWADSREGKREAEGFDNHACDTVLYGFRESPAFAQRPVAKPPEPIEQVRQMTENHFARIEQRRRNDEMNGADAAGLGMSYEGMVDRDPRYAG